MTPKVHIETERLKLRDWTDADREPFAALNADPRVMEFFPTRLDRGTSDALTATIRTNLTRDGYGLYATELKETGEFIGFVGLARPNFEARFMPAIEIGWRLSRRSWGQGLASEAAAAVRDHAFANLGLEALVSFTAEWNQPSRRVMEKIGMTHDPADDFIHPKLPAGHKLAPHVLYRISRRQWQALRI
ncbi:MAG TPA: GNAT family N-acetyltransferase [Bauldia sp.]|nr:GNAT family N-acetyltransferase [Bauldia sp.]